MVSQARHRRGGEKLMTQNSSTALPTSERLTGSLGFIGTLAQPLGVQAPTASAFIVPAVMAGFVGLATPLAFVLGVGIGLFVAYSFCLFARKYATAGSIYGFNRTALGPGYSFVSAWILLCAYLAFAAAIGPIIANYMNSLWPAYGNAIPWEVTSVVVMLLAGLLVFRSVELSAKVTATFESIGLICLLAICVAVLAKGGYGGRSIRSAQTACPSAGSRSAWHLRSSGSPGSNQPRCWARNRAIRPERSRERSSPGS